MFEMTFQTANAAFHTATDGFDDDVLSVGEVVRTLRLVAERIDEGEHEGTIRDANGNTVGTFALIDN